MGQDLKLFEALYQKMNWQAHRQKVIAQNIANADTPGYAPQDVKPLDFKALLGEAEGSRLPMTGLGGLATTSPDHLELSGAKSGKVKPKDQKDVYETAPAGNAVIIEEQLLKANELASDHRMMTNIYEKNLNLLRTALRGSGQ